MTPEHRLLAIYLDDHRAGAAAGLALARRVERRYGDEAGFEDLTSIRREIESDLDTLERLRDRLGVHGGRLKRAVALAGERIGRLKPNGRILRRSPLSRVLELELLSAGIAGKARLWDGLTAACATERLDEVDLRSLRERADDQLERVHRLHRRAATEIGCTPD